MISKFVTNLRTANVAATPKSMAPKLGAACAACSAASLRPSGALLYSSSLFFGDSIVALVAGASAGLVGWAWSGFERTRSRFLFAMTVGVAAGTVVALYA